MKNGFPAIVGALVPLGAAVGLAQASFNAAMLEVSSPLTDLGASIQSLDIDDTSFQYSFRASSGFTTSGFSLDVGGDVIDRTEFRTDVFRVGAQTTINSGGDSLTLNQNDLIFAYTIRLVADSTSTVEAVSELNVSGFSPFSDVMDQSLIKGRGFLTPDAGVGTPLGSDPTDLTTVSDGASLEWTWGGPVAEQLDNGETITLLMFTDPARVGLGFSNFFSFTGLEASNVDTQASTPPDNLVPALIPIPIPTPGALVIGALAIGTAGLARPRREKA